MKKLILIISIFLVSALFSGCCHFWLWPAPPPHVIAPAPVIVKPAPVIVGPGGHIR